MTPINQNNGNLGILSLPIDALHAVASYLKPSDWGNFALASKANRSVCREVVRRVRMHGFKCATEIVTACKLGHHEDAKELAALYISAGVPIYPRSLGHAHHTLLWRMRIEAKEAASHDSSLEDPFSENRGQYNGMLSQLSYLEVKTLFWMGRESNGGPVQSVARRDVSPFQGLVDTWYKRLESAKGGPEGKKKLLLYIHRHLLDQHVNGRSALDDKPPTPQHISLSADFYHPSISNKVTDLELETAMPSTGLDFSTLIDSLGGAHRSDIDFQESMFAANPFANAIEAADDFHHQISSEDDLFEPHLPRSPFKDRSVLSILDAHVYSAAKFHPCDDNRSSNTLDAHLRSRFESYHRRLESLHARGDANMFDECILDFWDEMLPQTEGIHYHDRHTAVPRITRLQGFLTKPCPKSIGVVQCEIERIRTVSRGKGVSVKGRLFPTYEYRLFIRSRPQSLSVEDDQGFTRRDTVLMVAKHRGRKHSEAPGTPPHHGQRKGSNNFFLHLPDQSDVDAHFNRVNDRNDARLTANGSSMVPVLASSDNSGLIMGRLQSNFIGTEFQIFSPRKAKGSLRKSVPSARSCVDVAGSSGAGPNDTNHYRRSRFGLLPPRRANTSSDLMAEGSQSLQGNNSLSFSDAGNSSRPGRSKRRAIANTPDPQKSQQQSGDTYAADEEEDGVITYTANFLGSRPRTMDVCVPKVGLNGAQGSEWRKRMADSCVVDDETMLTTFRRVLQQIEQHEGDPENEDEGAAETNGSVDEMGLLVLQNRPPWWNMELGSFVLNFGGRVSVASVKNFQLCNRHDQETILLQFGRIQGRHAFTMDFQHPLTAVQAFSIAISSLQSKISLG